MSLALLAAAILGLGMFGPALVQWSAPLLMRAPRLASGLLFGTLVAWSAAAAAVSLALAGAISGPQLFQASSTDVCRRCLASAGPFSAAPTIDVPVPAAALLLLPLLGIAVQLVLGTWRAFRRAASTRAVVDEVLAVGHRTEVAGHDVLLVPDPRPLAFTLPRRRGGMVVSHGLLEALPPEQLRAVLEHEAAHLAQHHHMILALLDVFAGPMQRIPLVAAVLDAVPLLLEVAADDASRHHTGTPALAGALLTLGEAGIHPTPSSTAAAPGALLHALGPEGSGPDRVGHLVAPSSGRASIAPLALLTTSTALLAGAGGAVLLPFALLLLDGCALLP